MMEKLNHQCIKNYLALISTLCLFTFCTEKKEEQVANSKFEVVYYRIPWDDVKYQEIIDMEKLETSDSTSFVYKYKNYTAENHRLVFYKDSLTFQNIKLKYIRSKKFTINEETFVIDKYLCYGQAFTFNLYIDKSKGLIATRNALKNDVIEYHVDHDVKTIDDQITRDSVFFERIYN